MSRKEEIKSQLRKSIGQYVQLGLGVDDYALEISTELIEDKNLYKFLQFTCDVDEDLQIIDSCEAVSCFILYFNDYVNLTSKITFYETLDLYKVSDCVLSHYVDNDYEASATVFKPVYIRGDKMQLVILEVADENEKLVQKEVILLTWSYRTDDEPHYNPLGQYDSDNTIVSGVFQELSNACYTAEYRWQRDNNDDFGESDDILNVNPDWGVNLWAAYSSATRHLQRTIRDLR